MVMRRAASSVDRAQFLPLQASIGPMFQVALDESLKSDYPPHREDVGGRLPSACADK